MLLILIGLYGPASLFIAGLAAPNPQPAIVIFCLWWPALMLVLLDWHFSKLKGGEGE
jgi:hypothetical protein